MRKLGLGLVMLGSLAITAQAETFPLHYSSSGVFVAFEQVDGCTYTSGVLFTETTSDGPFAGVFAVVENTCDDSDFTGIINGGGPVTYTNSGLQSATVSGTIETTSYNGETPATFEFSLSFTGTGSAIIEKSRTKLSSPGEYVELTVDSSRRRTATTSGTLTTDGAPLSITGAFIGHGTSGSVNVVH
jgi:hypothetical protein